jgi:hypothetical protein
VELAESIASRRNTLTDKHQFVPSIDVFESVATQPKAFAPYLMKEFAVPPAPAMCRQMLLTRKNEYFCICPFTHAILPPNDYNDSSEMFYSPRQMNRYSPICLTTTRPHYESTG